VATDKERKNIEDLPSKNVDPKKAAQVRGGGNLGKKEAYSPSKP
jgi:hypothetical protein